MAANKRADTDPVRGRCLMCANPVRSHCVVLVGLEDRAYFCVDCALRGSCEMQRDAERAMARSMLGVTAPPPAWMSDEATSDSAAS